MVVTVGISFNLIIIRVSQGLALRGSSDQGANTVPLKFVTHPTIASGNATGMEVAISREVEHEVSDYSDIFHGKLPPLESGKAGRGSPC